MSKLPQCFSLGFLSCDSICHYLQWSYCLLRSFCHANPLSIHQLLFTRHGKWYIGSKSFSLTDHRKSGRASMHYFRGEGVKFPVSILLHLFSECGKTVSTISIPNLHHAPGSYLTFSSVLLSTSLGFISAYIFLSNVGVTMPEEIHKRFYKHNFTNFILMTLL